MALLLVTNTQRKAGARFREEVSKLEILGTGDDGRRTFSLEEEKSTCHGCSPFGSSAAVNSQFSALDVDVLEKSFHVITATLGGCT